MLQHYAACADTDAAGAGQHMGRQQFRGAAGKAGDAMMLGKPVAVKTKLFGQHSQSDGLFQRGGAVSPSGIRALSRMLRR